MKKRMLGVFLSLLLALTMVPAMAVAGESDTFNLTTRVEGGHGVVKADRSGNIPNNTLVTITCVADQGYELDKVEIDGQEAMVPGEVFTLRMTSDREVVAYFKPKAEGPGNTETYNVTTSVVGGNGTITGGATGVAAGSRVFVAWTPDEGYEVDKVWVDSVETQAAGSIQLSVNANRDVKVSFRQAAATTTFRLTTRVEGGHGMIYADRLGSIPQDTLVTISCVAEQGYELDKVEIDGREAMVPGETFSLRMTGDREVVAHFKPRDAANPGSALCVVNAGSLNVRDAKDGNRIGGLSCGNVVEVLETDGEWSKIAYNDTTGWVKSEFLLRTYSKATAIKPMLYTVTANAVNVRNSPYNPGNNSNRIGGLQSGRQILVTGKVTNAVHEEWLVLDYDGYLGFVKADTVAPQGQEPTTVPAWIDKLINSILLNFSGSTAPSTTAKRMIYRAGEPVSGDSVKDNGDGSYEIVLYPDDGHNLDGVVGPEDVSLSIDDYMVTSVTANADGSKTVRMVKRSADDPAGQTPSGDSNQQSGSNSSDVADNSAQQPDSSSSDSAGATAKTGDSIPVLFLSVLLAVSLVVCVGSSMYGRRRNRL